MTQGQGSYGATSGSGLSSQGTSGSFKASRHTTNTLTSTTFFFPTPQTYAVRSNPTGATRRTRRSFSPRAKRWILSSCYISTFAIIFAVSLWLLLSFYASENLEMGGHYSRVYTANSFFVKKIVVKNQIQAEGPVIYGFSTKPALDQETNWTEVHGTVVSSNHHQEWAFWLNVGSQVVLQYNISNLSMELLLVVIRGKERMQKWTQDPSNSDLVSSWKIAQGYGTFQYKVEKDDNYYFAVGNLQSSSVQVTLQFAVQSKLYNPKEFRSQCSLASGTCTVNLKFLGSDVVLLTTPETEQEIQKGYRSQMEMMFMTENNTPWSVSVGFEQRWSTYLIFWGVMAVIMLILIIFCRPGANNTEESVPEAAPLMSSNEIEEKVYEPEHPETSFTVLSADVDDEGKEVSDDNLCIICFEARRNCFFDPCGHSATCYSCSMKIQKQKKSLCPLCRQQIRFVRRLFLL